MTQKEVYKKLGLPLGDHFRYLNDEVYIDDRGFLLTYDAMYSDWIHPRYEVFQTEYLLAHLDKVTAMDELSWHLRFDEPKETQKRYQKARKDLERVRKYNANQQFSRIEWYLNRFTSQLSPSDKQYIAELKNRGYLQTEELLLRIRAADKEITSAHSYTWIAVTTGMVIAFISLEGRRILKVFQWDDTPLLIPKGGEEYPVNWSVLDKLEVIWNRHAFYLEHGILPDKGGKK